MTIMTFHNGLLNLLLGDIAIIVSLTVIRSLLSSPPTQ